MNTLSGKGLLNIWIRYKDGCRPANDKKWQVNITSCCGKPPVGWVSQDQGDTWKKTKCYNIAITNDEAHLMVKVPPGCYVVDAWERGGKTGRTPVNETMAIVSCDQKACVNLLVSRRWFLTKANIAIRHRIGRRSAAINDLLIPMVRERGQPVDREIADCLIKEATADAKTHVKKVLRG